jgi:hypothetical protein
MAVAISPRVMPALIEFQRWGEVWVLLNEQAVRQATANVSVIDNFILHLRPKLLSVRRAVLEA